MDFLSALEQQTTDKRDQVSIIGNVSAFAKWWITNQGGATSSGATITEHSALSISYAWSAINVLAQTVGHPPLRLMRRQKGKSGAVPATDHALYQTMKSQPNSDTSSMVWRETLEGHRNGWGNAYSEILGGRHPDDKKELAILLPDRTRPVRINGEVVYETRSESGRMRRLSSLDVIHVPGLSFNGLLGYSPVQLHKETLGLGRAALLFGNSFFGRGANARGVIEADASTKNTEGFSGEFQATYGGLGNSMATMVLPKGLKYKPISINPDDAQFLATRTFNRTEVAGIYRVPPHFIMALENATFTNTGEMDQYFAKHTMLPIYARWEQELDRKLLTAKEREDGLFFKFNMDVILRGLPNERARFYQRGIFDGWLKRNEVREKEDMEVDDPALDTYLVPHNMQTAEDILEPLIDSMAQRIAIVERRELERIGEDFQGVADFYAKHKNYIRKVVLPVAKVLERSHGVNAQEFTDQFIHAHLANQMALQVESIAEAIPQIREQPIKELFLEEMRKWTSKATTTEKDDFILEA